MFMFNSKRNIYKHKRIKVNMYSTEEKKIESIKESILRSCIKPMRMVELQEMLQISRGALRHHLNVLEDQKLILPMKREIEGKGRPTFIQTNVDVYKKREENRQKEKVREEKEFLENPLTMKVLKMLSEKNFITKDQLIENFNLSERMELELRILVRLSILGYIEQGYKIKEEGKRLLSQK